MAKLKFKRGNKFAFPNGHIPHNKDQKSCGGAKNVITLRNGSKTYSRLRKSKKDAANNKRKSMNDEATSSSYSLRKSAQQVISPKQDLGAENKPM